MNQRVFQPNLEQLSKHCSILCGYAFESTGFTADANDDPLVKDENIHQGYIDWAAAKRWPRDRCAGKYRLLPGDIVVAMDRPWVTRGLKWSYIRADDPEAFLVQRVARLRARAPLLQDYLRCVIGSPHFAGYIEPIVTGVNVPHISAAQIGKFLLPVPATEVQQKVAAILTAYDDLIENNKRRIALLEKMAEEIYREWFVRLRFPGYKSTPVHKGVPKGWTEETTEKAFNYTGGGTPSKEEARFWEDGQINWYTPSDITASAGLFLSRSGAQCTDEGLRDSSAKLFPAYSVMLTSRATIGAIGINTTPACTNQGFITCMPNPRYPLSFLYHWLKLAKPHFEMLSSGATFAELTKGTFKRIRILRPTDELVSAFDRQVAPMFGLIEKLLAENGTLSATRDLLLGRLISGKLRVDHLDIRFPPSMQ